MPAYVRRKQAKRAKKAESLKCESINKSRPKNIRKLLVNV
ncbi:hypothetical protein CLOLEP_02234 [[Clostridium] leptum DSM 753]|uniref:Uncharacterized protein n=1 Tax=[Clostridium] leptum DSM 753 TaxID=428125 RepID=A7VUI8_9FIRM|nr:hypothetical protein CLOLEP_02234 [[Clostridium] leptum DSM 753]